MNVFETIHVAPADVGKAHADFLEVPYLVQGADPNWVPPLRTQQREAFDTDRYPFYRHARARLFVAYRDGRPVGRVAAIDNAVHNQTHRERATHWGYFECVDDERVSGALFAAVEAVAAEWGHDILRGPFSPSVNEEIGLLIEGFDTPPMVMIPYNPPYYRHLVEAAGHQKSIDLYCFRVDATTVSEKLVTVGPAVVKRGGIRYRPLDRRRLDEEGLRIWQIYNQAWERNWLWVHATREEFLHLVRQLSRIADYDLALIAENAEGEAVGFSIAIPDVNEALIHLRDGRLLPLGWLRLLRGTRPGAIRGLRFMAMGVIEAWRGRGIDIALNYLQFVEARRKGYTHAEMSQILETNMPMIRAAEALGGERYKTHRMFEKMLRR